MCLLLYKEISLVLWRGFFIRHCLWRRVVYSRMVGRFIVGFLMFFIGVCCGYGILPVGWVSELHYKAILGEIYIPSVEDVILIEYRGKVDFRWNQWFNQLRLKLTLPRFSQLLLNVTLEGRLVIKAMASMGRGGGGSMDFTWRRPLHHHQVCAPTVIRALNHIISGFSFMYQYWKIFDIVHFEAPRNDLPIWLRRRL